MVNHINRQVSEDGSPLVYICNSTGFYQIPELEGTTSRYAHIPYVEGGIFKEAHINNYMMFVNRLIVPTPKNTRNKVRYSERLYIKYGEIVYVGKPDRTLKLINGIDSIVNV